MYQIETKLGGVWTRDTLHTYDTTDEAWEAASRAPEDLEGVRLVDVRRPAAFRIAPPGTVARAIAAEQAKADAVGVKLEARLDAARAAASAMDAAELAQIGPRVIDGAHLTWVASLAPGDRLEWQTCFGEWCGGVVIPLPEYQPESNAPAVRLDSAPGEIMFSQDKRRIRREVVTPEAEHEATESAARDARRRPILLADRLAERRPPEDYVRRFEAIFGDAHRTNPGDAHKSRPDLIPADALLEVGAVLEWGTRQPGLDPDRWERKSPREHIAAAMRHTLAHLTGAPLDTGAQGSGRPHLAHAAARLMYALAVYMRADKADGEGTRRGLGL